MESNVKLYSLSYDDSKTYLFAALFVIGNIALPQVCHLMPQGGWIFLPIYFFTLIGAYKYGMTVGLLTAIASPLINSALFGMPSAAVLPAILIKSTLLAVSAAYLASRYHKVSLLTLTAVVLAYQVAGSAIEMLIDGNMYMALQDFRLGVPGMLLQIFGGFAFIKYIIKK
jgi:hypothetical protein